MEDYEQWTSDFADSTWQMSWTPWNFHGYTWQDPLNPICSSGGSLAGFDENPEHRMVSLAALPLDWQDARFGVYETQLSSNKIEASDISLPGGSNCRRIIGAQDCWQSTISYADPSARSLSEAQGTFFPCTKWSDKPPGMLLSLTRKRDPQVR